MKSRDYAKSTAFFALLCNITRLRLYRKASHGPHAARLPFQHPFPFTRR
jgi:hypothetical protein